MTNFSGKNLNAACGGPQGGGRDSRRTSTVADASAGYFAHSVSEGLNPVLGGVVCLPGYKQTEVGVIPEDWDISSLGLLSAKITDGTHDTPRPVREGRPFLTAIHVKDGHIDFDGCYFVSEIVHQEIYRRCNPEFGDILMVNIGAGTATTAVVDVTYEFSLKNVALIKPNKFNNGTYVNYALSFAREKTLETVVGGGAQPFLSLNQIANLKIAVPHLKEQTAIANALSDVDALISELEKLTAKKQAIKTATMQQLLTGRTRLPPFSFKEGALREDGSQKGTKPSELGEIPEDWEVVSLGAIATFANGKPYEEFVVQSGSYQLITLDSVSIDGELKKKHKAVNFYDESLLKGDLVCVLSDIAHARLLGLCGLIETDGTYVLNQRMGRIRFDLRAEPKFMRYLINANQEFFRNRGQGSSQRHIYKQDVFELSVALPNRNEQTAIATILSEMDEELQALEQRLSKTRQIKQGMMQELLTGRTRLV